MPGLPEKKIAKIKIDANNTYDVVPSMLQDGTTNNKLSVPTLTEDSTIAVSGHVIEEVASLNEVPDRELGLYKYTETIPGGTKTSHIIEVTKESYGSGEAATFEKTTETNNSQLSTSSFYNHFDSELSDYLTVTSVTNVYALYYTMPFNGIRLGTGSAVGTIAFSLHSDCDITIYKYFGYNGSSGEITSYDAASKVVADGVEYSFADDTTPIVLSLSAGNHTISSFHISSPKTAGRIIITCFEFAGDSRTIYTRSELARTEEVETLDTKVEGYNTSITTRMTNAEHTIQSHTGDIEYLKDNLGDVQIFDYNSLPTASVDFLKKIVRVDNVLYQCVATGDGVLKEFEFNVAGTSEITASNKSSFISEVGNQFGTYYDIVDDSLSRAYRNNGNIKLGSSSNIGSIAFNIKNGISHVTLLQVGVIGYGSYGSNFHIEDNYGIIDDYFVAETLNETLIDLTRSGLQVDQLDYLDISTTATHGSDEVNDRRGIITRIIAAFGNVNFVWEPISSQDQFTETVDLDDFGNCEDTAFIEAIGELPMSADELVFTYFFTGNKCVVSGTKYEVISGLDITEAQYNAIKDCMILDLTSSSIPVTPENMGAGTLSLRKQSISTASESGSTFETVYFCGGTNNVSAIKIISVDSSTNEEHSYYELYYFKVSGTGVGRDVLRYTAQEALSDADLASIISGVDWDEIFLGRRIEITKGWRKTLTQAELMIYWPFDANDDHIWYDNYMWVSVPGRPIYDYLMPGPVVLIMPMYISDALIAIISVGQSGGDIIVLQYETTSDVAPLFSTSSTYAVGDLVTYKTKLYRCTTAVTSAGNWNANNWTETSAKDVFALDSNVVHKSGNETISGTKTFNNQANLQAGFNSPGFSSIYQTDLYGRITHASAGTYTQYGLTVPITAGWTADKTIATTDDAAHLIETTWAALKQLRDNSELIPGRFYRITDYTCTTTTTNTSSAGHVFDIIVLALETNKLSEEAWAAHHTGDTYFANNNLSAWKLWYCLDNNKTRFDWADATNGKGVLYRLTDEFNNECPYDFKNILFTTSGKYTNAYTFTYTENSTIKDASILGLSKGCYNNIIKEYVFTSQSKLNFNVFYSTSTTFNCYNNAFEINCYNNTFGYTCNNNNFEMYSHHNSFGNSCCGNIFGDTCHTNTFGDSCSYNTFGEGCYNNKFGIYNSRNTFGNYCYLNTFGNSSSAINYCRYNIIDSGCQNLYIVGNGAATSSNYLQNIHIHSGVKGSSSSDRKTITVDRNLEYTTDVYPVGSIEMFI